MIGRARARPHSPSRRPPLNPPQNKRGWVWGEGGGEGEGRGRGSGGEPGPYLSYPILSYPILSYPILPG